MKNFFKQHIHLSCFLFPFAVLSTILLVGYLFGHFTWASNDCFYQYVPFFGLLCNKLKEGSSLFYTSISGLGFDFYTFACYYLFSPLNIFITLFNERTIILFINLLILVKVSFAGFAMSIYLKKQITQNNGIIFLFSIIYALCGYVVGYCFNIMWMDGVALLPLLILAMDKMIETRKSTGYILLLALVIISNYMIGYMICIYLFIRFFTYKYTDEDIINHHFYRFAFSSIVAAMISCFILIPSYLSLKEMSVIKDTTTTLNFIGSYFNELASLLFLKEPNAITFDAERANLYITIFALLSFFIYFIKREIPKREKIVNGLIISIFLLSFNNEWLNYIWHGFHKQSGIPNRFAFLLVFHVLCMLATLFSKYQITKKETVISAGLTITLIGCITYFGKQAVYLAIVSIILVILYSLLYHLKKQFIIPLVCVELFVMAIVTFCNTGGKTTYGLYDIADDYSTIRKQEYKRIKIQDLDDTSEKEIYNKLTIEAILSNPSIVIDVRNELKEHGLFDCVNESFLYNVDSISMFNTFCDQKLAHFYLKTGSTSSSNTLKMFGDNSFTDMILSIDATIAKEQPVDEDIYELSSILDECLVYENKYSLPIGYGINEVVTKSDISDANPFVNCNTIAEKIAGETIYSPHALQLLDSTDEYWYLNTYSFKYDTKNYVDVIYLYEVVSNDDHYLYFNSSDIESLDVYVNDELAATYPLDKRIVKLPEFEKGDTVKFNFHMKKNKSGTTKVFLASMDNDKLKSVYDVLSSKTVDNIIYEDGYYRAETNFTEQTKVLITIPVQQGWKVTIDGEEAETEAFTNCFYTLDIESGKHVIEMTYRTPGFDFGVKVTLAGILLAIIIYYVQKKKLC